eukprot:gene9323-10306_t
MKAYLFASILLFGLCCLVFARPRADKRERANKYNDHALEDDEFDDEDDLMQDEPRDEMEFREESPQSPRDRSDDAFGLWWVVGKAE